LTPEGVVDFTFSAPLPPVPPRSFRPLEGEPEEVKWHPRTHFLGGGKTEAQKRGLRFEEKVQMRLRNQLGPRYFRNPFLEFTANGGWRSLVPDGIFFSPEGLAFLFEVKAQHMPEAWWQLRQLYEPVVRNLSFVNQVSCIEVVRSYDPAMGFPEPVKLCRKLDEALDRPVKEFKVLELRL